MKKSNTIITLMCTCILLFSFINSVNSGTNSDDLTEVKIGTQTWATKNLDVSTFRNGDAIPEAKTNEEWIKAGVDGKAAWCYYNNDTENGKKYGKLYNWYAVNDPRGLAPKGWHIPSDAEWTILTDYLGGKEVAGTKMKNSSGWNDYEGKTGNGTNESEFSGSLGGCRSKSGRFLYVGRGGVWWGSSEGTARNAWYRFLFFNIGAVHRELSKKRSGHSVRCLRD